MSERRLDEGEPAEKPLKSLSYYVPVSLDRSGSFTIARSQTWATEARRSVTLLSLYPHYRITSLYHRDSFENRLFKTGFTLVISYANLFLYTVGGTSSLSTVFPKPKANSKMLKQYIVI